MIQLFQTNFPPQTTPLVDSKGCMTIPGMAFWRALWQRTGAGPGLVNQVALGLVASGSTQANALALTADWNLIGTTPNSSGVILPALTGGQSVLVVNGGVNPLNVYPPLTAQIDALGVNSTYALAASKMQVFNFFSSASILSTQLG